VQKVLVHPSDTDGCGYYRIVQPATALANLRPLHFVVSYKYYLLQHLHEHSISTVVCQRHTEQQMLTHLQFYKSCQLQIVHDLDDLLWQVPISNSYRFYFNATNKKILHTSLKTADRLVTSTVELAEQTYKFVRKDAHVLPNYVSSKFSTEPVKRKREKLRIGWAGSNTHAGDLSIISPLISETLDKYQWVFMGYCEPQWLSKVEYHDFVKIDKYMEKLASLNLDAVVIPLEDNLFNKCKSHIKLLEFATLGVPAITTDISPYKENPNFKIKHSKRAWKDFMDCLKVWECENARHDAAMNAWRWSKKFCLEDNVDNIRAAWGL
jgi:hypothetical protein